MVQRGTLIAVLVGVEIALVVMMAQSLNPGAHAPWHDAAMRDFHGTKRPDVTATAKYAFATSSSPTVVVDVGLADVTISRQDAPGVNVSILPDTRLHFPSNVPALSAHKDGDTVTITAEKTNNDWRPYFADDRMIMIAMPAGAKLSVIEGGDIRATGLRGVATINSTHGTILVEDFNAPALHVSSSNGRLTLRGIVAQTIDAQSSNGRVEGTALQVRDGRVDSSNGRVNLGFAPGADTVVTAASSNGSVRVSGFGSATVSSKHTGDDDDDDDSTTSKTIRIGAGNGRLDVHASNGSINLSQEG